MASVRETINFRWNSSDALGQGATATVFRGFDKRTGEPVAIKCFSSLPSITQTLLQRRKRELDVFKKLNHENVVKLIAIEKELATNEDVIVMELCTGPCLFTLLKQPSHINGFEDEEFLLVLKHLTSAMKHLRENHVSHRDLKPGNVMKHVNESGEVVYKVTDFGTALEAEDGQEFLTLCGTAAYMNPNIFAKVLMPNVQNVPYNSEVDLWSIGATLYHIATGQLPFRPYNYQDLKMFYILMTKKPPGSISGVQETADPFVEFSDRLPNTCRLSHSLQKLITPLFAGLFEVEPDKKWTFEKFFDTIDHILSHTAYNLFLVNSTTPAVQYLPKNAGFNDLENVVQELTKIPKERQLFIWNGNEVTDLKDIQTLISETEPLLVIDLERKEINIKSIDGLSTVTSIPDFKQRTDDWQLQAKLANEWLKSSLAIVLTVGACAKQTVAMNLIVYNVQKFIDGIVAIADFKQSNLKYVFDLSKQLFDSIGDLNECVDKLNANGVSNNGEKYEKLLASFSELDKYWSDIQKSFTHLKQKAENLKKQWTIDIGAADKSLKYCVAAEANCSAISEICNAIVLYSMTSNDPNLIDLEKLKLDHIYRKHVSLLTEKCVSLHTEMASKLEDWYPNAMYAIEFIDWITRKIDDFHRIAEEVQNLATTLKDEQKSALSSLTRLVNNEIEKKSSKKNKMTEDLRSFLDSNERLSALIQENQHLIDSMNRLSF